jgi:nicotinamide/nicotinate riboside kinase
MHDPLQLFIGIGGVSQSGKSTLAEKLTAHFNAKKIRSAVLNQDDFVFPKDQLPLINGLTDWERPETIDWSALENAVIESRKTNQVIIFEGLFAFNNKKINEQMTHFLYLEIVKETFLKRKNKDTRWATPPDWYVEYIWATHKTQATIPENANKIDSNNTLSMKDLISVLHFD